MLVTTMVIFDTYFPVWPVLYTVISATLTSVGCFVSGEFRYRHRVKTTHFNFLSLFCYIKQYFCLIYFYSFIITITTGFVIYKNMLRSVEKVITGLCMLCTSLLAHWH